MDASTALADISTIYSQLQGTVVTAKYDGWKTMTTGRVRRVILVDGDDKEAAFKFHNIGVNIDDWQRDNCNSRVIVWKGFEDILVRRDSPRLYQLYVRDTEDLDLSRGSLAGLRAFYAGQWCDFRLEVDVYEFRHQPMPFGVNLCPTFLRISPRNLNPSG